MTILDSTDNELITLWTLIAELSDQLNQNRSLSVSLYAQAAEIKTQAIHTQTGFVLRRFNPEKSKEEYESELERMNAAIMAENQGLQHDNKQLGGLIKDFESTLETLMSTFRNRAKDVQERELSLIRDYEQKLLVLEERNATQELTADTAVSASLARLSHVLRQFIRLQGGEDAEPPATPDEDEEREPWNVMAAADYALEREIELARLEKENEELRRMMGLVPAQIRQASENERSGSAGEQTTFEPSPGKRASPPRAESQGQGQPQPLAGGSMGAGASTGPYGTYKGPRLKTL